jgi:uncharacterized protein YcbK (DUF882 family)
MAEEMLTRHFSKAELACPCCGACEMDSRFMWKLENIRAILQRPMHINSGYRCKKYNATLKNASPKSMHMQGKAVDVKCQSAEDKFTLLRAANQVGMFGLGFGATFMHMDSRELPGKVWVY